MAIGSIYKIAHNQLDIVYVGSTFKTLKDRWSAHKAPKNTKCIIYPYIKKYGAENFKIILIKEYEVIDRNHLESKEQLWINKLKCININNTIKIQKYYSKHYYEQNKLSIAEKGKLYRNKNANIIKERKHLYNKNNKDKISDSCKSWREKNKERIECYCGANIYKYKLTDHKKSKKHLNAPEPT